MQCRESGSAWRRFSPCWTPCGPVCWMSGECSDFAHWLAFPFPDAVDEEVAEDKSEEVVLKYETKIVE